MSDQRPDPAPTIQFTESDYFTGPQITDEMISLAEARLGVRLPASYVELLRTRNGGEPVRHCHPVAFPTSWAKDHIDIGAILGIGGTRGIDAATHGTPNSPYMVAEWVTRRSASSSATRPPAAMTP